MFDKVIYNTLHWIMGWSGQCKFPTVTPVVDDDNARKLVKAMLAAQQG